MTFGHNKHLAEIFANAAQEQLVFVIA